MSSGLHYRFLWAVLGSALGIAGGGVIGWQYAGAQVPADPGPGDGIGLFLYGTIGALLGAFTGLVGGLLLPYRRRPKRPRG